MDMLPPHSWHMPPAEVRHVDSCTPEWKAAADDDQHHCHNKERLPAEYSLNADSGSYRVTFGDSELNVHPEHVPEGVVVTPPPATARTETTGPTPT